MGFEINGSDTSAGRTGLPIGNGNLFETSQYLQALENDNQKLFLLYIMQENYFTGLYDVEGDEDLKDIFSNVLRTGFRHGAFAVTKINGIIMPFALVDRARDYKNDVYSTQGIATSYDIYKPQDRHVIFNKKTVFGKWGYNAFSGIFVWYTWLHDLDHLLRLALTNSKAKVKKWQWEVNHNDSQIIAEEMKSFLNPDNPFYLNYTQRKDNIFAGYVTRDEKGKESPIGRSKHINPNTMQVQNMGTETNVWQDITEFMKWLYMHMGKRYNYESKNERTTPGDHVEKNINFQALETDVTKELRKFVNRYNKMYNKKAKLIVLTEKLAQEAQEKSTGLEVTNGKQDRQNS